MEYSHLRGDSSSSAVDTQTHGQKPSVKIVAVGDGKGGKTQLLHLYKTGEYNRHPSSSVEEHFLKEIHLEGHEITLSIWDTAGQEEFDTLLRVALANADVFLICCSVVHPETFRHAESRWAHRLEKFAHGVPYILVGTECDLRDDAKIIEALSKSAEKPHTNVEGHRLADAMKAAKYVEVSASNANHVNVLFLEAGRLGLEHQQKHGKCVVM